MFLIDLSKVLGIVNVYIKLNKMLAGEIRNIALGSGDEET